MEYHTSAGIKAHDTRRPRVLLLAHSCGPDRGSEPGIGWNRVQEISRYADTWVVVNQAWKVRIEQYVESNRRLQNHTPKFVYVPRPDFGWLSRVVPGLKKIEYHLWQKRALKRFRSLHREIDFDLAHQLTFIGFREPSYLCDLGVPVIWGPVGGAQNYPWKFLAGAGAFGGGGEVFRNLLNLAQLRWSRRVLRSAKSAAAVIAANSSNARALERWTGVKPLVLCDVGVHEVKLRTAQTQRRAEHLRVLWAGVHETRKAMELLIEALVDLPDNVEVEVHILGEGPCTKKWQRLAKRRRVDRIIKWLGAVEHQEALAEFEWADVFVFTSLRDTTGTVLLESLASGTPIICVNHQGASDVVTPECGIRIAPTSRSEVVQALHEAIISCANDPKWRATCSEAAIKRAQQYEWSKQATRIANIYNNILTAVGSAARCELLSSEAMPNSRVEYAMQPHAENVRPGSQNASEGISHAL